jgi:hypothetical protein
MYVSINVHTYKCMYLHMYVPTYVCTFICMYLHMYVPTNVSTYICMYLHMYAPTYVHTYISACLHIRVPTNVCTYPQMYVSTYLHMYTMAGRDLVFVAKLTKDATILQPSRFCPLTQHLRSLVFLYVCTNVCRGFTHFNFRPRFKLTFCWQI